MTSTVVRRRNRGSKTRRQRKAAADCVHVDDEQDLPALPVITLVDPKKVWEEQAQGAQCRTSNFIFGLVSDANFCIRRMERSTAQSRCKRNSEQQSTQPSLALKRRFVSLRQSWAPMRLAQIFLLVHRCCDGNNSDLCVILRTSCALPQRHRTWHQLSLSTQVQICIRPYQNGVSWRAAAHSARHTT